MPELVAVVPAGGLGTRMLAVTGGRPKSLTPVLGKPFLHLQLAHLRSLGVDRVHLCLGHGAEEILGALPDSVRWGLAMTHTIEARPLGVIGAVRLALPHLPEQFLMTYGDVLPPPAVTDLWRRHRLGAHLATVLVTTATDESNIDLDDAGVVVSYAKTGTPLPFVDIGLCALTAGALRELPAGVRVDEESFFRRLIARRQLQALRWPTGSLHIGDPDHHREVESALATQSIVDRSHAARTSSE